MSNEGRMKNYWGRCIGQLPHKHSVASAKKKKKERAFPIPHNVIILKGSGMGKRKFPKPFTLETDIENQEEPVYEI